MKQVPLLFPFLLAVFAALFATAFFPQVRLFAFAPFLALIYMRENFIRCLWLSALCGAVLDLLTSQVFFGFHAICYSLTTFLLYSQKRHFFDDKPLALSLFTALISSLSTLLQLFILYGYSRQLPISIGLLASDLVIMPVLDGAYAFFWFTCPLKFYIHIKKVGWQKAFRLNKEEET